MSRIDDILAAGAAVSKLDLRRYLAAREAACSKRLLEGSSSGPAAVEEDSVRPSGAPDGAEQETAARPSPQGAAVPAVRPAELAGLTPAN